MKLPSGKTVVKWFKNVGTLIVVGATLAWFILKYLVDSATNKDGKKIIKDAKKRIKERNQKATVEKEGIRNAKGVDAVAAKLRDIHKG